MSQGELATALGVSRQTINSIENGRYLPSLPLALAIARKLGWQSDFPWERFARWAERTPHDIRLLERRPVPPPTCSSSSASPETSRR